LPQALWGKTLMALPEVPEVIEPSAPWQQAWQDTVWTASFPLMRTLQAAPQTLPLVLHESAANPAQGHVVTLQLQGAARVTHSPAVLNPAPASAAEAISQAHLPLWAAVLGALLGGLILNLMPCVLPVLAIKLLSFTQPGLASATHRRLTWAYGVGVVLSFVSLGALMLLLRGLGLQLGWGFQLQLPLVVAALAALFTLLGLNLSGVFEFGQLLPSRWASVEARHPSRNAFLSGVLAVVVASPCTAPFMGAALGLAWSLPAPQTLLIFATMGLGMALPFVLVSHVPALARRLPKPGAWMLTFRRVMAFPMYATVVWLVWVLGQQSGADAAAALLALLVALSAVVWACTLSARLRLWFLGLSLAVLGFLIWAIGPQVWQTDTQRAWAVPRAEARWQAWTPDKVTQLLASGRPVFVDFTAAWCVTCQYNKRTTLADARVLADMDLKNVATLRADWTLRNPTITQTLNQLGRNGVPTYALYVPGQAPLLLSELLSVAEVRAALARL
jgi:thiol:disulfide interchange protein